MNVRKFHRTTEQTQYLPQVPSCAGHSEYKYLPETSSIRGHDKCSYSYLFVSFIRIFLEDEMLRHTHVIFYELVSRRP